MLEITPQQAGNPAVSISLDDVQTPTELQDQLFDVRDSDLPGALLDAASRLVAQCDTRSGLFDCLRELDVDALDGLYARYLERALSFGGASRFDLLDLSQDLGGQTRAGVKSSLDDIRSGPVRLFEAAAEAGHADAPLVQLVLDESFLEAKATARRRFVTHLQRLTPGFDVRVTGSALQCRKLLELHGEDLPDSVNEDAQQSLQIESPTATAERATDAKDALEAIDLAHDAWDILEALSRTRAHRLTYATLYDAADVSDSAVRKRISLLRDHGLVETRHINGDKSVLLAPTGDVALDQHPHVDLDSEPSPDSLAGRPRRVAVGPSRPSADSKPQDNGDTQGSVSDPRNTSNSTVSSNAHTKAPGDRRVAADAAAPGPAPAEPAVPQPLFMNYSKHHAVAAAAESADISLLDRPVDADQDRRQPEFSYEEDRDEVVTSVNASPNMALTAVRMCAALLSDPALNQVLTRSRLAGGVSKQGLGGLCTDNPYVLQRGPQLGWLQAIEATAEAYRDRLETVRKELLKRTNDIKDEDGYNSDACRELLRDAHGLRGVVLQLYDQLGVDVVEEITLPNGADSDFVSDLREFLGMATSIGSSYDIHSAHRVLHEERPGKRSFMFNPNVDLAEPTGHVHSSIVISGDDASDLQSVFSQTGSELEHQEGEPNYERFLLPLTIDDANGRQTIATAAGRWCSELNMRPEREPISMLAALTGNVIDASTALSRLQAEDEATELDCKDIRFALSTLDEDRIMPDYCGSTVSAVVSALLDATETLTTSQLAEIADVSKRSIQLNDDELSLLEAAGLIERTEQENGNATLWRLNLAFSEERKNDDQPLPDVLRSEVANLPNVVSEVLLDALDDHSLSLDIEVHSGTAESAFYGSLPERDLQPWIREHHRLRGLVTSLAMLSDDDIWLRSDSTEVELGREPRVRQSQIQDSAASAAD